jgi:UDP-N-acetylmuramate dehydrogenase
MGNKWGTMMRLERLRHSLSELGFGARVRVDEPMASHSSFAIGGPADLFVSADTIGELDDLIRAAWEEGVPVQILGSGTNILVSDAGVRGLVIVNNCAGYELDGNGLLIAKSGALLRQLAQETVNQGWAGLEWAVGIPGTIGGAAVGNAGAYGGCMADNVRWVDALMADGSPQRLDVGDLGYAYRSSVLKREPCRRHRHVVTKVALQLVPADREDLLRKTAANNAQREARNPRGCCAGSIFKRTPQYPPGFLIEQAGLKGRHIGGAQVSPKHANFIMNVGDATAADVRALIDLVQQEVLRVFGERLEPEIEFVGQWSWRSGSGD